MAIWKAQRTLLIVGEGRHEEAFLNHVKQLYAPRGCGLSVTIKNARGKGASVTNQKWRNMKQRLFPPCVVAAPCRIPHTAAGLRLA